MPRSLPVLALAALLALPSAAQVWTGPAALEVRVDDERGKPVEGAEVVLAYGAEVERPAPVLTDRRGRAAIGGLAGGRWLLEVRHQGHMTFRATLFLAADEKPVIEFAAQHNVPGAAAPMRVRLERAKGAPPARPLIRVAPAPTPQPTPTRVATPPPMPVATPTTPEPAPTPAATPAPTPVAAPAPEPLATPVATAVPTPVATPAPTPVATPVPAPIATPEPPPIATPAPTPVATPVPAPPQAPGPIATPAPTPVATPAPAPAATATPAPAAPQAPTPVATPAPVPAATPAPAPLVPPARMPAVARTCYECGPGEQALYTEVRVDASGGCDEALRGRLAGATAAAADALLGELPAGCALLRIDVPKGMRYLGFRYEAGVPGARSEDCFPDRPCGAGGCRFVGDPLLVREESATTVFAIFEVDGGQPRTGGLTVYYAAGRRR